MCPILIICQEKLLPLRIGKLPLMGKGKKRSSLKRSHRNYMAFRRTFIRYLDLILVFVGSNPDLLGFVRVMRTQTIFIQFCRVGDAETR